MHRHAVAVVAVGEPEPLAQVGGRVGRVVLVDRRCQRHDHRTAGVLVGEVDRPANGVSAQCDAVGRVGGALEIAERRPDGVGRGAAIGHQHGGQHDLTLIGGNPVLQQLFDVLAVGAGDREAPARQLVALAQRERNRDRDDDQPQRQHQPAMAGDHGVQPPHDVTHRHSGIVVVEARR